MKIFGKKMDEHGAKTKQKSERNQTAKANFSSRAAIVANGTIDPEVVSKQALSKYGFIIGCDGGGMHLYDIQSKIDLLVGDFDSMSSEIIAAFVDKNIRISNFPKEKTHTDLQLAVDAAFNEGFTEIDLFGVTGNRLDHTLTNMMLLFYIKDKGGTGRIIDKYNVVFAGETFMEISKVEIASLLTGNSEMSFSELAKIGHLYVSFVVIEDCTGMTLEGFKYPLDDFYAKMGESRCISNELLGETGTLRFNTGKLIAFVSRD